MVYLSRRHFVRGLYAGGVGAALSPLLLPQRARAEGRASIPVLSGTEFHLEVSEIPVNFTGKARMATVINGSLPAPTLVWREGDTVTLRVTNRLKESTSIHWHGIVLPYQMDGVPGVSFNGIAPGETFVYQFTVRQSGSYWYHSHSAMQEMTGLYGALIILPKDGEPIQADRDHTVLLSDWSDDNPMSIFGRLKQESHFYNRNLPTVGDFFTDVNRYGVREALAMRQMWQRMRMEPTDIADVTAATFTYLTNGTAPAGNWTGTFEKNERVRLRFINGSSNTFFDVRIPGLPLTVVQSDGQNVEPVTVDEFRFGPGETYDVIVEPKEDAYTLFAQSMDRSGYACGTLARRAGLRAPIPESDKPVWLTHADMMGDMGGMHGSHSAMAMDHSAHASMDHSTMAMDHGAMNHESMGHGAIAHGGAKPSLAVPSKTVRHARTEYGPSTDMRVDTPRTNLDDPGIGLRNNGRRVLTLADLSTIGGPMDKRLPEREIELHLTGNMERYSWSFDGLEFGQSAPVHFRAGERLRVILQNDTMMTHPMHLHGMWSELENDRGEFVARRHTIPVQPAQRISFQVTADALGRWVWHCHLLFHMDAGMFREVVVS